MERRLRLLGISVFALISMSASAIDITFEKYHSQAEINSYLAKLAEEHSDLVSFHELGSSLQNRATYYVVISRYGEGTRPALYFNGTHHGNEKSSTEGILGLIDYIVDHRDDPAVADILDKYEIYLQPMVNPDGHAANTREDSLGRDPNRDYAYPDRDEEHSFKIPSIQLVKELMDNVKFKAAVAYHSGMEGVLWPWCYSSRPTEDKDAFLRVSKASAQAMGMNKYVQSYNDYKTLGEFIDFAYMKFRTMAVTFEVSTALTPSASQLAGVVERSIKGALAFIRAVDAEADLAAEETALFRLPLRSAANKPIVH